MTKLQRLKARLIAAGLAVDEIQLQNVGPERVPVVDALRVNTDYIGLYPDAESSRRAVLARKLCKGRFYLQNRGFYQAVYIREFTPGEV